MKNTEGGDLQQDELWNLRENAVALISKDSTTKRVIKFDCLKQIFRINFRHAV